MRNLKEYTKDDLRKAIAVFAYNWQTNIMGHQLAVQHKKTIRELTIKDFYDELPTWEGYIEYDVEKLDKAVFNK